MRLAALYVRTAVLASLALAAFACQTAQKPVSLLPPAKAPALQQTAPPAPPPPTTSAPAPAHAQPTPPHPHAPPPAPTPATTSATAPAQVDDAPPQTPAPAEASPAPAPASARGFDPVADLIARAEKEYHAGLANHQAGKTDEAKQNFDNALNALLSSNLDIRSDDRLQEEFDRVVQGVNELYPGGTGTDTEAQQKSEPAPIDETNGLTPAPDAGVKAKAQAEIKNTRSDLPLMMTDQVAGYITYFSNRGRGGFERAFSRSGRYHDMI